MSGCLANEAYGRISRYNLEKDIRIVCVWWGLDGLEGDVLICNGGT